ncbi:phage tail protein [Agarivorans sp. Z349TD_8]|uniref:phage tail protein n=1 Tax=Agarivorans sp. Z349TD_8 TaxID=3421434 RepID=UPI003D7DECB5
MSEPFLAEIQMLPYTYSPRNWAWCDGRIISIGDNSALYAVIGTLYGGDGRVNMGLPNLKGRVPMHAGQGFGLWPRHTGDDGGTPEVTILPSQIPPHTHELSGVNKPGTTNSPDNKMLALDTAAGNNFFFMNKTATPNVDMASRTLSNAGGTQGHENRQPYLAVNFCIALMGDFPLRN